MLIGIAPFLHSTLHSIRSFSKKKKTLFLASPKELIIFEKGIQISLNALSRLQVSNFSVSIIKSSLYTEL